MKLNLKDEPREWRKSALLAIFGLALICSLMRWRKHLPQNVWLEILAALTVIAIAAILKPRWFRGYHLFSMRLGFVVSKILGRIFLTLFFIFILTPIGWILRWAGKDSLQLKRPREAKTYWREAKDCGPLDRLF
jgi:hypothetical protein